MSSSAREVRLGSPPGIGLLMKWMTWALIGALPSVAGGCLDLALDQAERLGDAVAEALRLVAPLDHAGADQLDRRRVLGGEEGHRRGLARLNDFLPWLRSRLRILTVTSPKSMSTGHGFSHLWQIVQWSATSSNSAQCASETPRRVCSS